MTDVSVVVWGYSQVGKTALIARLREMANTSAWDIQPTVEANAWVEAMAERRAENRFPEPTAYDDTSRVVYRMVQGTRTIRLSFEDRAGGRWETLDAAEQDLLVAADAVVILLDPSRGMPQLQDQLDRTLNRLFLARGEECDDRPVAICLTKFDRVVRSAAELRAAREEPDTVARNQLTPEIVTTIERRCLNVRFFPLSAVGVHDAHGSVRNVVFWDEQMIPRVSGGGTPVHLYSPFDWIASACEDARE